ncbi:sigma-70 family RNA polymerase sigma factor [Microbacterium sp. KUDC0406]|uniref:RNA polymerase sigma factor n=1 Tax=Microbacterium sp. KUDC0406 TaxID=2909588 RepID=UPI001F2F00A5|nr:sigma-70 family RNA polymerase sigma factor [Microbacterium sp. KUDC0406]UJP09448.1 sigma-70 family RNA polymerase sigma factor [Microbacterium sp. KUDC0406]
MSDAVSEGSADQPPAPSRWRRAAEHFRAWRDGDARAMDDLVRLMTPVLWHVVRAYGVDRALAEDVVQTTWLRLVRGQDQIADASAVSAWLTTTARREAWRAGKAQNRADATDDVDLEAMLPAAASAEEEATTADGASRLWAAVRRLDERCRRLIRVIAFEERPDYKGIAQDLGMPIGSIGPTRARCLTKLRTLLGDEVDGTQAVT